MLTSLTGLLNECSLSNSQGTGSFLLEERANKHRTQFNRQLSEGRSVTILVNDCDHLCIITAAMLRCYIHLVSKSQVRTVAIEHGKNNFHEKARALTDDVCVIIGFNFSLTTYLELKDLFTDVFWYSTEPQARYDYGSTVVDDELLFLSICDRSEWTMVTESLLSPAKNTQELLKFFDDISMISKSSELLPMDRLLAHGFETNSLSPFSLFAAHLFSKRTFTRDFLSLKKWEDVEKQIWKTHEQMVPMLITYQDVYFTELRFTDLVKSVSTTKLSRALVEKKAEVAVVFGRNFSPLIFTNREIEYVFYCTLQLSGKVCVTVVSSPWSDTRRFVESHRAVCHRGIQHFETTLPALQSLLDRPLYVK